MIYRFIHSINAFIFLQIYYQVYVYHDISYKLP